MNDREDPSFFRATPGERRPGDPPDAVEIPFLGVTIGERYQVVERIGAGGMGTVYLAKDRNLGGRSVVLKVPHPTLLLDPGFKTRFEREVRSLLTIDHPHVVKVLDAGSYRGIPYVVLPYLSGGSLATRLREAPGARVSPETLVPWLLPVARALDHMHAKDIVHRDVKPENVLMDEIGGVYLADFGIAKALGHVSLALTGTGFSPGTPEYMAPEQAVGESITGAADQYALAITAYEALAGRVPFTGDTPLAVLMSKEKGAPTPLRDLVPEVPPPVAAAVMQGLARDPSKRFSSCLAMVEAMQAGMPVAPRVAPSVPSGRRPRVGLLLGVVGALLLAGGGFLWWRSRGTEDAPQVPVVKGVEPTKPTGGPKVRKGSLDPNPASLLQHVEFLAGPDLGGRGDREGRLSAAGYVSRVFEDLGLQAPPGRDSMFHVSTPADGEPSWNVVGWLPGRGLSGSGAQANEYVLVSAHTDGFGKKDGVLYPSADNNASGVAALLELARTLVETFDQRGAPRRSVAFVSLDLSKAGAIGARRFVADEFLPLKDCVAMLTMDQMGRSLADIMPGMLFVLGTESSAALEAIADRMGPPKGGHLAVVGLDFFLGEGDVTPFREAHVPAVYLSAGYSQDYQLPGDIPGKIDPAALAARTAWVKDLVLQVADLPERPVWREGREPRVEEIRAIRGVVSAGEERLADLEIPEVARTILRTFARNLDALIAKGAITPAERESVRRTSGMLWFQSSMWRENKDPAVPK